MECFGERGMEGGGVRLFKLDEKGVGGKAAVPRGNDGNAFGKGAEGEARLVLDPCGEDQGSALEEAGELGGTMANAGERRLGVL